MSAPDSTPSDYAGLSKQEVAERLKNPTPDATATPRSGVPDAEYWKAHYERIERELAAAKAEIARVTADFDRITSTLYDRVNDVIALKDRAERAEAELRERTQWQCKCGGTDCAGMAENERLKAEVAAFKANNRYMRGHTAGYAEARDEYGEQLKPLFAKVRELEQDKARLIDSIDVEALDAIANELTSFADSARAHSLMSVAARQRAAIDAARAGKGAT